MGQSSLETIHVYLKLAMHQAELCLTNLFLECSSQREASSHGVRLEDLMHNICFTTTCAANSADSSAPACKPQEGMSGKPSHPVHHFQPNGPPLVSPVIGGPIITQHAMRAAATGEGCIVSMHLFDFMMLSEQALMFDLLVESAWGDRLQVRGSLRGWRK